MADKPKKARGNAATKAETPTQQEKGTTKTSSKLQGIINEIENLSVVELAELVKALEDKFGISAAVPVAVPITTPTAGVEAPAEAPAPVPEKSEFDVILAASGANKIAVIKAVREVKPNLGLKEAKDLVEKTPQKLLEGAKKEEAEEAKKKLEAAGAQVELK